MQQAGWKKLSAGNERIGRALPPGRVVVQDPIELSLRPPFAVETKDPIPVAAADDPPGKIASRTASSRRQRRLAFARLPSPEEPEMLRHWRTLEDPMGKIGSGRCSTRLSYMRLASHGRIRTPDHLVMSDEPAPCATIGPDAETPGAVV
jgi:hypothetical protein